MIKAQKTVDITNSKLLTTWKFTKLWTRTNEEVEAIFIGKPLNLYDKVGMTMLQRSVWQCELMSCYTRDQYDKVSICHAENGNRYDISGHCHAANFGMTIHSMTYDLEVKFDSVWQCKVMSYHFTSVWHTITLSC